MSGRVASPEPVEIGAPSLAITKLPVAPPTSRETKIRWMPLTVSSQATHGTLSLAPVKAMSGSTPLRVGSTFRLGSRRCPEAGDARLLPAEAADRRDVSTDRHTRGRDAVAVGLPRPHRPRHEDLVRV